MKITTLGFCASIYVPTTIGCAHNQAFGKQKSIDIANRLTMIFNGANIREIAGYYKSEGAAIIEEITYVVTCFTDASNRIALISELKDIAFCLCSEMKQECVAIEYGGEMHLISI